MPVEPRRRKRILSVYLSEDIVKALEKVAGDSDLPVSRVLEVAANFPTFKTYLMRLGRPIPCVSK
jgi:predicted nucleotide-binding protein (sugar kinase/HSP70/actin superfamily)